MNIPDKQYAYFKVRKKTIVYLLKYSWDRGRWGRKENAQVRMLAYKVGHKGAWIQSPKNVDPSSGLLKRKPKEIPESTAIAIVLRAVPASPGNKS